MVRPQGKVQAMFTSVGIIGVGFVGTAVREGLRSAFQVESHDRDPAKRTQDSVVSLLRNTEGPIFLSVPTPMNADGSCDTSIVRDVLERLAIAVGSMKQDARTVVIKSTVPPGSTVRFATLYRNALRLVFNPEFLTEANYVQDFKNQDHVILGTNDHEAAGQLAYLYAKALPNARHVFCDPTTAEMVKYITNCFLAVKVAFANEMKLIADKLGIVYDEAVSIAMMDPRLGTSHWRVPGPVDGLPGFSGSCFPKDINSLLYEAKQLGVEPTMMQAAWNLNLRLRPQRDWELLKGRAVTAA